MGSKLSIPVPPISDFFKSLFSTPKIIKKIGHFVDFWILMAIYMDKLDQFKKFNCRTFRITWNITKIIKTEQFFHITFYFWKSGVWGLEKPIAAKYNSKKTHDIKSHMKFCFYFNILVIFQLILIVLQLMFFKLVLFIHMYCQKNSKINKTFNFVDDFFCAENSFLKKALLGRFCNWLFWTHFWIPYAVLKT